MICSIWSYGCLVIYHLEKNDIFSATPFSCTLCFLSAHFSIVVTVLEHDPVVTHWNTRKSDQIKWPFTCNSCFYSILLWNKLMYGRCVAGNLQVRYRICRIHISIYTIHSLRICIIYIACILRLCTYNGPPHTIRPVNYASSSWKKASKSEGFSV